MKPLTDKQLEKAQQIMEKTTSLRKPITLYRWNDPNYAMFRIQAMNMIQEAVISTVANKPYSNKLVKYLDYWSKDLGIGKDITALFNAIQEAGEK